MDVVRASFRTLAVAHGQSFASALEKSEQGRGSVWDMIRENYDISETSASWLGYQRNYVEESSEKLDYYAELIGNELSELRRPSFFTCPYWMSTDVHSREWQMTRETLVQMSRALNSEEQVVPIVAWNRASRKDWALLQEMIGDVVSLGFSRVFVWVNDFREHVEPIDQLRGFRTTVSVFAEKGVSVGMLYGGYFSLALGSVGLWAFGNGVGYSESRAFAELSSSGGPPPRYYVLGLHRYLQQAIASRVLADDVEGELDLASRVGQDPATLRPDELMAHFVRARGAEIGSVEGRTLAELSVRLVETADYVEARPRAAQLVDVEYLRKWAAALA